MGITLIVQRVGNDESLLSGLISIDEWLALVEEDEDLRLRADDHVARNSATGQEIRMAARPGEADLRIDSQFVPFLAFRDGALTTSYRDQMSDPDDQLRRKIGQVARTLNAVLTTDAGDDILDW